MSAILAASMSGFNLPEGENLWMAFDNSRIDYDSADSLRWNSIVANSDLLDPPPIQVGNGPVSYLSGQNYTDPNNPFFVKKPVYDSATQSWRFTGTEQQVLYYLPNGGYINATYNNPRYLRNNICWNIWFRWTTGASLGRKIIGCQNALYTENGYIYDRHFYVGTDQYLYWGVFDKSGSVARTIKSLSVINQNQWYFASASVINNTWYMYLGTGAGSNLGFQGQVTVGTPDNTTVQLYIGGNTLNGWPAAVSGDQQYWTGDIHGVYIYQTINSSDLITRLFDATKRWPGRVN